MAGGSGYCPVWMEEGELGVTLKCSGAADDIALPAVPPLNGRDAAASTIRRRFATAKVRTTPRRLSLAFTA